MQCMKQSQYNTMENQKSLHYYKILYVCVLYSRAGDWVGYPIYYCKTQSLGGSFTMHHDIKFYIVHCLFMVVLVEANINYS